MQRFSARLAAAVILAVLPALPVSAQSSVEIVRQLYNTGRYEQAISAATRLRTTAAADVGAVLLGRSLLERYRKSRDEADLNAAADALRAVRPTVLAPRDRTDYLVGLAELLYLQELYGPAAELFRTAYDSGQELGPAGFERTLDWWATALDRQAQSGTISDPHAVYSLYVSIRDRSIVELGRRPGSVAASYWLASSCRYLGDWAKAYDAAVAGWVRAPLAEERGLALRADLDQLVTEAVIPEWAQAWARSRQLDRAEAEKFAASQRAMWEAIKRDWPNK